MTNSIGLAHTIFNVARTSFAFAEDSIKTSDKVQIFILCLDAAATCFNGKQVYDAYEKKNHYDIYNDPTRFHRKVAMCGLALLGVTACVIKGTNHAFAPKINLSGLIPSEAAGQLTACWKRPLINELFRGLFFVRIVLNLGLVKLGAKPSQPISDAILMGASFAKMSHTQWIQVTRTSLNPFEVMNCTVTEGGSLETFKKTVSELKLTFDIKTTTYDTSDLTSKIKSVYEYSTNMFEKSSWSRFWETTGNLGKYKEDYSSKLQAKTTGENVKNTISFLIDQAISLFFNKTLAVSSSDLVYEARLASGIVKPEFIEFVNANLFHTDKLWKIGFLSSGKLQDSSERIMVRLFGK